MFPRTSEDFVLPLNGLRGFAFLLVLLAHFSNYYELPFKGIGKVGVWLFFVLSSFLLTRQFFLPPQPFSPQNIISFFRRRALRIIPPYFAALTVFFGLGYLVDRSNIIGHLLFVRGAGHFWTVAVEMQFYLVLPLIAAGLLWLSRLGKIYAITIMLIVWGGSFLIFPPNQFEISSTFSLAYLCVFFAGCIAAYIAVFAPKIGVPTANTSLLISVAALIVTIPSVWSALVAPVESTAFYRHYPFFSIIAGTMVLCCGVPGSWAAIVFSAKPLTMLGRVSFSGYLMHPLALNQTSQLTERLGAVLSMIICAVAVTILTLALYRLVEKPLLEYKPKLVKIT